MTKCKIIAHAGKISGMSEIALAKQQLREDILLKRKEIANIFDVNFTENLLALVAGLNPIRVAIYQSYKSEPNTELFINSCPIPVLVPISKPEGTLEWEELETGKLTEIHPGDLLVIPALAVDHEGNRLGRGKGYFDRTLDNLPDSVLVYAVVFAREFIPTVPTDVHDRQVNGVVTEAAIHKIK